jgi:hypothetical protein
MVATHRFTWVPSETMEPCSFHFPSARFPCPVDTSRGFGHPMRRVMLAGAREQYIDGLTRFRNEGDNGVSAWGESGDH